MGDIHQYSVTLFNTNWIFVFQMTDLDILKQERWYHQRFKTQAAKVASTLLTNDTNQRAKRNLQQHSCNIENHAQQFWLLLHAIYSFLIFKDSWGHSQFEQITLFLQFSSLDEQRKHTQIIYSSKIWREISINRILSCIFQSHYMVAYQRNCKYLISLNQSEDQIQFN